MRACLTVPLKGVPTPIRKLARVPAHKNRRRRNDSAYFKRGEIKEKGDTHKTQSCGLVNPLKKNKEEENTYKRNVQ